MNLLARRRWDTCMDLWRNLLRRRSCSRSSVHLVRPEVEALEHRVVPYSLTGSAWPHKVFVTLGVVPDGTNLGGVASNQIATFNSRFGSQAAWQNQYLKAAQTWAQYTDLNFHLTADSGAPIGSGSFQQGDPSLGDIRIGGYDFGSNRLAQAYLPPSANNFSIAGDTQFNTGQSWVINTTGGYDLFTVALHEIGHALGLGHSTSYSAAMYPYYVGQRLGLDADDSAGIRAIYSNGQGRTHDAFDRYRTNDSFATSSWLNADLNPTTRTALVGGLDITTTADVDYFRVKAPAGTSGTFTVKLQSSGFSLLSPALTIYNGNQQQVGYASGAGQYGATLSVTVTGVRAGQRFYIKAAGANSSVFGMGGYGLTLNFGSGPSPSFSLPWTATRNASPLQSGSPVPETGEHDDHGHRLGTAEGYPDRGPTTSSPAGAADPSLAAVLGRVARSQLLGSTEPSLRLVGPPFASPMSPAVVSASLPVIRPLAAKVIDALPDGDAAPTPVEEEASLIASSSASGHRHDAIPWSEAFDALFREEGMAGTPETSAVEVGEAVLEEASLALDPLAAVLGLALVWGSSRAVPCEDARRRFDHLQA